MEVRTIQDKIRFSLTLFGTDDGDNPEKNPDVESKETEGKEPKESETKEEEKKYSDKEVDEIISEKFAKWQRAQDERIKEEKRLSKLSADERAKEESKKKDDEIARLKAEIDRNNLEKDTIDRLNEEGLPLEFKSFLMGENAEKTNETIKAFKDIYQKNIQEEVEKRFKGKTPPGSSTGEKLDVWGKLSEKYK